MQTVAVTGASGFIGSAVSARLRADGDAVVAEFARDPRRATYPDTRAREELGWSPRTRLADGITRTRGWAREAGLLDRT